MKRTKKTTKTEVRRLVRGQLELHGLDKKGWRFGGFSNARKRLGKCNGSRKEITVSQHHVRTDPAREVENTVLHEIAHALDFEARGTSDHGPQWKKCARIVGADPNRTAHIKRPVTEYKWWRVCPNCGAKQGYYRRPSAKHACGDCCRRHNFGRFTEEFLFDVVPASKMKF